MMLILLLIALVWPEGVYSLRNVSQTPGVVAAETLVRPPLDLCTLEELAEKLQLSPAHTLKAEYRTQLPNGNYRARIRIHHNHVPVRGFLLTATQIEDSYNGAISGYIPNIDGVAEVPDIPVSMLKQTIVAYVNDANQRQDVEDICAKDLNNFLSEKQILIDPLTGQPTVIYFIRAVVSIGSVVRWPRLVVDALSGDMIQSSLEVALFQDQFDISDAEKEVNTRLIAGLGININVGSDKNGDDKEVDDRLKRCPSFVGGNTRCQTLFGPAPNEVCLNATVDGDYTVLANDRVVVYTLNKSTDKKAATIARFKTIEGPDDAINNAFAPAADAFHCATKALDLLLSWGKETLDYPKPFPVYVHFGVNFSNSMYDGSAAVIGDGHEAMYPLSTCELVGHEIGHAVLDSMGNLIMRDESRGVAEGFADVFAKSLSAFLNKDGKVTDWIFADCGVRDGYDRIRFYDSPSRNGFGIDQISVFNATNAAYRALGIITKFFYCMVGTKVTPVKDVFRMFIWANRMYFDESSGFTDAACGLYRSGSDLELSTEDIFDCFQVVGINLSFCSLEGTIG